MEFPDSSRRGMMTALGAGAALGLAGCISAPEEGSVSANDTEAQDEELDAAKTTDVDRVAADPTDVPDPINRSSSVEHDVTLTTQEVTAELEPGVTFDFMTFEGRVPGPMIRVRRGDTVNLTLESEDANSLPHNIDFHAVYGPGGGAEDTTIGPGESATISFQAMYPGVHIYHCAVSNMDQHISAGMYGAILVEPEDGLPEVDRELYFGQNEIYTNGDAGQEGHHKFDFEAMKKEEPTYVTFNGEPHAFTGDRYGPIEVEQDESVRIFLSNGGPNLASSWHAIGNVWTKLYRDGSLASEPDKYVETCPVRPGTVAAAEIDTPVPQPIKIVDHSLTRAARKGALGVIQVNGEERPEIFNPNP
ncbi:copper-containing nitrite reductase [Salinarchaeum laminariae]|uniref:copper-containing nitrite reductase n=1 Tax=Salinarchaeum laminariae TaxID=869888 RepID=UPI0020C08AE4|nr:copper-containing nitrite reductase [Salinarchaeum laminariae]